MKRISNWWNCMYRKQSSCCARWVTDSDNELLTIIIPYESAYEVIYLDITDNDSIILLNKCTDIIKLDLIIRRANEKSSK